MAAIPIWRGSLGLEFQPDSGAIILAERVSTTDIYRAPYSTCESQLLRRGTYGTGFRLGWVVTSSKVESERGGIGKLTVNWETGGPSANAAWLPLEEFDSAAFELYPRAERNPFFSGIGEDAISLAHQAVFGATTTQRKQA